MASSSENIALPRPSVSDAPVQQGPIGLFDHHLKVLSDSYLSFFQDRAKIEEVYIDSLLKLHRKVKAVDTLLDSRSEPSTVRQAWNEVRDNVEREAQTRQAFYGTLTVDVINPLLVLKETQDRTRKRIKEDIKDSTSAHVEYAENVLPRLKRTYLRRCQEVEDLRAMASPTNAHPPPASLDPLSLTASRSNPTPSSPPTVTAPQPLRPLARRPSGHQPQPRNRSPSTSTALQDLAHSGKRQLNQLMTFLDNKGGKDGLGNTRGGDAALRSVRLKREADEADKEYRKGVHWLETLRIRRIKILEGGFKSLELFIEESAETLKKILEKYADNATATTTTQTHLSEHVRAVVGHISPQKDTAALTSAIPRYLQQSKPRRTLYQNHQVGDCHDLMFGVGLVDYTNSRMLQESEIPKIVRICVSEVDKRGLNSEGIYRVSGRHAVVQDFMHKIERDERNFHFAPTDDVFVAATLLKQYLRELPEPVFKFPLEERVKHSKDIDHHIANNFLFLRGKMRRLPVIHQATLRVIIEHLARVAANCEKNKMDAKNLAIIFSGVIFGEDEMPKDGDLLSMQSWKDTLMEDLIVHASMLFDERGASSSSPPLPPAPAGEPLPNFGYGSSHTQVANMPPPRSPEAQATQDFTPQLPPRPGNSIHPSRRANAQPNRGAPRSEEEDVLPALPPRPVQAPNMDVAGSFESDTTVTVTDETQMPLDDVPVAPDELDQYQWDAASRAETFVSAQTTQSAPESPKSPKSPKTPLKPKAPAVLPADDEFGDIDQSNSTPSQHSMDLPNPHDGPAP